VRGQPWPALPELIITVHRMPSLVAIAMDVAPLVRRGVITDAEGHALVELRYRQALAALDSLHGGALRSP